MTQGQPSRPGDRIPTWLSPALGALGAIWVLWGFWRLFGSRVLSDDVSPIGKTVLSGLCLSVVAFVISAYLPFEGQNRLRRGDVVDVWRFIRAPKPAEPPLRGLWTKLRRSFAILAIMMALMFAWGIIMELGLAKAQ